MNEKHFVLQIASCPSHEDAIMGVSSGWLLSKVFHSREECEQYVLDTLGEVPNPKYPAPEASPLWWVHHQASGAIYWFNEV